MKNYLIILISTFFVTACYQKNSGEIMNDMVVADEGIMPIERQSSSSPPAPVEKIEKQEVNKKKIIKDGRMGIKVSDLFESKKRIDSLINKHGGYYANEDFNNYDRETSYSLSARIPGNNFEKFIADIESGEGEIIYKEINARDVTDQFIDLETRLDNKRNYLLRYKDLLKQAKTIKDILEIEEKIRVLEEEIESTVGRLKYLADQVDYSTLELVISKEKEFKFDPQKRDKFSERLKQSLSKGWIGFVDFLLFIIKIWPFWLILTIAVYTWKKIRKRKKEK